AAMAEELITAGREEEGTAYHGQHPGEVEGLGRDVHHIGRRECQYDIDIRGRRQPAVDGIVDQRDGQADTDAEDDHEEKAANRFMHDKASRVDGGERKAKDDETACVIEEALAFEDMGDAFWRAHE